MHEKSICLALSVLMLTTAASAEDARWKSTAIVPGITMLESEGGFVGGNLALIVGADGVALIDDGMEPLTQLTLDAVNALSEKPVDFVINTHIHGDHLGGNKALHEAGATIVAHDNIRKRLEETGWQTADGYRPAVAAEMPQITFSDALTFHLNGHTAHVFHVPHAHTDGDSMIHFPDANVIHAADVLFNGMFPFIDLDSGGSVDGFIAGLKIVLDMSDDETKIIPGHGPLAHKADVQAALDMLVDADSRIRVLVNSGKTEEDIVAANPLADYHDQWNWEFITTERMTRTLIRSNSD